MADGKVIIATDLDSRGAVAGAKKLGSQLKSGIGSAAGVAVKGIAAVGTASVAAGGAMVKFAKDTAETGDHIDKMSQKLGISAEAYQKWDYVAQISGTNIDSLKMGFKTLGNTIDQANNGNDKAIAKFEKIGLTMDDLKGKSKEQIFEDTIKGLQNVSDETERAALANQLLGRAGQELGPMLNSSNKDIDELMKKAEDYGMIMSDDAVKASAEFTDSLTTMGQTFQGLKNRMTAEFLPSLTEVTDGLSLLFKGDTEEGLKKINKGIEDFTKKLTDILPKVLEIGGSLMKSLGSAILKNLPQIIKTGTDIVIGLVKGVASAIPQVLQMLPEILKIIGQALIDSAPVLLESVIEIAKALFSFLFEELPSLISDFVSMLSELDLSEMATGIFETLSTAMSEQFPVLLESLFQILTDLTVYLLEQAPMLIETGLNLALSLVDGLLSAIPSLLQKLPTIITALVNGLLASIPKIIDAGVKLLTSLVDALPEIINTIVAVLPEIIDGIIDALIDNTPAIVDAGFDLLTALVENLPRAIITIVKSIPKIVKGITDKLIEKWPDIKKAGYDLLIKLFTRLPQVLKKVPGKIGEIWTAMKKAFNSMWENIKKVGKWLIEGLWEGIKGMGKWIGDKVEGFCEDIGDSIMDFFGIASPSKLMKKYGRFIAEGLIVGFDEVDPMEEINKSLAYGMNGIDYAIRQGAVVDYSALAEANATAMEGTKIVLNDREVGRAVRGYA